MRGARRGVQDIILLLCAAVVMLTACHKEDGEQPVIYDETLLMYMPWTTNLTNNLQQNIIAMKRAIQQAGGLGTKRLLVFIAKSSTQADLYEVKYSGGACINDTLHRYTFPETDYTTAEGLTSILTDALEATNTEKYSMIIGCHGSGWLPVGKDLKAPKRRAFGTASATPRYQTEISTLARAIDNVQMPMQFILFDDCYMAGIEVAYELRNATHYLIGSTCEIMDYGMPYEQCGIPLLAHDYYMTCQRFYDFYSSYSYPYGTLSVIDCSQTEQMAELMKRINAKYDIEDSRLTNVQVLDGCTVPLFFDMGSYVHALVTDPSDPLLQEFNSLMKLLVPHGCHTPTYVSYLHIRSGAVFPINTYSGITISDPTQNSEATSVNAPSWWAASHQ